MLHVGSSLHLLGELVTGEPAVHHLLVARAYEAALLVDEDGSRTAEEEEEEEEAFIWVSLLLFYIWEADIILI